MPLWQRAPVSPTPITAMFTIRQHQLLITDAQELFLPPDATILSVNGQGGDALYLWVMGNVSDTPMKYTIRIVGTGQDASYVASPTGCIFRGTAHMPNGFVHVFVYSPRHSQVWS